MPLSETTVELRCPYPSCAPRDRKFESLSGGVYRCGACSRLAAQCGAGGCEALNRPLSHFCRKCGRDLTSRSHGPTLAERWRDAAQFDYAWQLASSELAAPLVTAHLENAAGFRSPEVLLQWTLIDGLLALHQGGGFVAVTHPFAGADESDADRHTLAPPLLWSQPENGYVQLPDAPYRADLFRPYPPRVTGDRRYLLFSTPYAAFVLDRRTLPGWSVDGRHADFRTLFTWSEHPHLRLAAAPVPLSHAPHRAGLLLYNEQTRQHGWSVVELDDAGPLPTLVVHPLPMQGDHCQWLMVGDQALAISTEYEHWVWRLEDALQASVAEMARTWPRTESHARLVLDQDVANRQLFSWPLQHLATGARPHAWSEKLDGFEWCYQFEDADRGHRRFESYGVSLPDLSAKYPSTPAQHAGAIPLGPRWPVQGDDEGLSEFWFLSADKEGRLYRRSPAVKSLEPTQVLTVPREEIQGLRFDDPLLTVVSIDADKTYRIKLFPVHRSGLAATAERLRLVADPLIWSNWLFTCERDENHVLVRRRRIVVKPVSLSPWESES